MITLIKNLILTSLIVAALQTQWDGRTLETRATHWLAQSNMGQELRLIVLGALEFINLAAEGGSQAISDVTKKTITPDAPGQRGFSLKRSPSYFKEKASNIFGSSDEDDSSDEE